MLGAGLGLGVGIILRLGVVSTWSAAASAIGASAPAASLCPASWVAAAGPPRRGGRLDDDGRFLAAFLPLCFAEDGAETDSGACKQKQHVVPEPDHVPSSADAQSRPIRSSLHIVDSTVVQFQQSPRRSLCHMKWRTSAASAVLSTASAFSPASAGSAGEAAAANEVRAVARVGTLADDPPLDRLPPVFAATLPDAPFLRFAGRSC